MKRPLHLGSLINDIISMASAASRMAGKVGGPISKVAGQAAQSGKNLKNQGVLQKGAKRDPELYVGHTYAFQSMLSELF